MFSDVRHRCHAGQQGSGLLRDVVVSLPTHVPAIARTQMGQGSAAVLAAAMEALSMPAFICDGAGVLLALTSSAEALLRADLGLCVKSNRLCLDNLPESQELDDAIATAAFVRPKANARTHRMIVVRGGRVEVSPLVLEVISLSRGEYKHDGARHVLVVARGTRASSERRAAVVQAAYGLTAAETQIAIQLGAGETPQAIAAGRGVAVGTVRAQIKTICAKLGVRRQTELLARLNDL